MKPATKLVTNLANASLAFFNFFLENLAGNEKSCLSLRRFKQPPGDLIQSRGATCRCVPSVVAEMPCDAYQYKGFPTKGTLLSFGGMFCS